jgi:hypothetical protein
MLHALLQWYVILLLLLKKKEKQENKWFVKDYDFFIYFFLIGQYNETERK